MLTDYLFIGILIINVISFILMGWDKNLARKRRYRIPEARFFLLSLLGGALGSYLGMRFFHHKTQHKKFVIGIPFLLVLNLLMFYGVWVIL